MCARRVYMYPPPLWNLATFGGQQIPRLCCFCFIPRLNVIWIKNNLIPEEALLRVKTNISTVTAAPTSTNFAASSMPECILSLSRSLKQTTNSLLRYQSPTNSLRSFLISMKRKTANSQRDLNGKEVAEQPPHTWSNFKFLNCGEKSGSTHEQGNAKPLDLAKTRFTTDNTGYPPNTKPIRRYPIQSNSVPDRQRHQYTKVLITW